MSSNYQITLGHPVSQGLGAMAPFAGVQQIADQIQVERGRVSMQCTGFAAKRDAGWLRKPNTPTVDVPEHPPSVLERSS